MFVHPLDSVRKDIGGGHFHRGGKIDNHGIFLCRSPFSLYRVADFQRIVKLGAGKALGRILQNHLAGESGCVTFHHLYALHGDIDDLLTAHVEYHIPLQGGSGIINVHDRLLTALDGFKGALHKLLSALGQNLHDHVVGNQLPIHELAQKIIFDLACRRETDLDFLKAEFDKIVKKLYFLGHDHGINQRLIAVAQIHAAPDGRFLDLFVHPLSFRVIHHRVSAISLII